jgi:hypothetical protein
MDEAGSIVLVKSGSKAYDFEVHQGETGPEAMDRYIVFLARTFDVEVDGEEITEEQVEDPSPELVQAAFDGLQAASDAPKILLASTEGGEGEDHGEGEGAEGEAADEEHATIHSPVLGVDITGVDFSESQRLALVIPYFRSVYSDVNNTLALGFVAFFFIQFWGFSALGPGYLSKFFNLNGVMSFVGILELLSEFIRVISFAFRLFGNIFAGEVLILMLTFLMPFLIVDLIYGLELFVGFIQAAVFALLTLVFGSMAMEHHGDDEHHEGGDAHAGEPHEGAAQTAH